MCAQDGIPLDSKTYCVVEEKILGNLINTRGLLLKEIKHIALENILSEEILMTKTL